MPKQKHTEYRGFRTPGIRLTEPLIPNLVEHSSRLELPFLYAYHWFDKAHLVMLAEEGLIPVEDAAKMLRALREMEAEGVEKVRLETEGGMHSGEQYLIRRLGEEVGGRIHLGRSSGDLNSVGRRVVQRDKLLAVMKAVNSFRAVVLKAAEDNLDAVLPGYTHAQHAQPTTLGHQFMAWASVLERDFQRLDSAYSRVNISPAGAAIMTGSSFPLNRQRTAELLGFDGVIKNTFDAILSHDPTLECACSIAILHANFARWADDLDFWYSSEAGMIDIPDRFCGTSSIMMQKKNPYALELIRGAAAGAAGLLTTAFMVERARTGTPILERRYTMQGLLRAFDDAVRTLEWLTDLIPAIKVNKERMRELAGSFWAQATDVAAALVREKDLPWRTAHQIVGILVRFSYERGIKPRDVTPALLDEAAVEYFGNPVGLSEESLRKALDPVEFVNQRTLYGGPSPEESRRRLPEYRAQLEQDRATVSYRELRLNQAKEALERAIDALIDRAGP